ncbi:MAG: NAD-dependent epimerase/dehydratase family protein [Defluviitaleaceae bacterium]|nr:NAD-dependent epimerase/dehydratase family protein [Defluviitaleaceae bacterium]MCL2240538.1 NAD-dependent epimerase/dehydratase family protein [Defluviitaleaceae bacterium]
MKILVIGGTQYVGVHLVRQLLADGHEVTIATRGKTKDNFTDTVSRIIIERTDATSINRALTQKHYDVVYDSQAYSSNEIKYLMDAVSCGRYIETSTASIYSPNFRIEQPESDFDPVNYRLKWCSRDDFGYDEVKRQAECAMFQIYSHIPSVAVRFPLIIGEDDYTNRLFFYIDHIVNAKPMHIDNLPIQMGFIMSHEAGKFLAWLADKNFCGSINAANSGSVKLGDIIKYVEAKTGIEAIILADGEVASFNGFPDYSLDLSKARSIGYHFPQLDTHLYTLLDKYVENATAIQRGRGVGAGGKIAEGVCG